MPPKCKPNKHRLPQEMPEKVTSKMCVYCGSYVRRSVFDHDTLVTTSNPPKSEQKKGKYLGSDLYIQDYPPFQSDPSFMEGSSKVPADGPENSPTFTWEIKANLTVEDSWSDPSQPGWEEYWTSLGWTTLNKS